MKENEMELLVQENDQQLDVEFRLKYSDYLTMK